MEKKEIIILILLIVFATFLRFPNLGYSEFQSDEKKTIIRTDIYESKYDFLINQRKGPVQYFITSAVLFFTKDPLNEFSLRLPFAVLNTLSVVIFYLILKDLINEMFPSQNVSKIPKNVRNGKIFGVLTIKNPEITKIVVPIFGTFLYLTNGFIVGFSRIVQYQSLNLLFSFLALYFFVKLSRTKLNKTEKHKNAGLKSKNHIFFSPKKNLYIYSFSGVFTLCISLLSHWDAVFFLIPIIYFYILFMIRKDIPVKTKLIILVSNLVLCALITLPFLIPYVYNQLFNPENIAYLNKRVGISGYPLERHKFIFELYNPFVTMYFLAFLSTVSLVSIKKVYPYVVWFVLNFLIIRFFMEKPGTHIYNYVLPAIFLAAFGIYQFARLKKTFYYVSLAVIGMICAFLFFQSYMLYVDNTREYPWDDKILLKFKNRELKTEQYSDPEILTFGFPHFRNWKKINEIISDDPDHCTYITNEGKEISQIYVKEKFGIIESRGCYFIIDVKRPFNAAGKDVTFAKTSGKDSVYIYKKDDRKLVRMYKIYD